MPPATYDVAVAGPDPGGAEHDRLEARAADAVDRRGGRRVREAGPQQRLPRRSLAGAALQDLAHDDLVDAGVGRQPGPIDGRANRNRPSSTAGTDESEPPNFPMGVLAALTMNACPSGPLEGCMWPSVHRARTGEAAA